MKLSEGVEWRLHCVCALSGLPQNATLPARALAEYHGLSEAYLARHLQALANAQIIESVPGPKGGYRLTHLPEEITLLDVVEAIDGREQIFRCMEIRQRGPFMRGVEAYHFPCGIRVAMAKAEKAWREALRVQTIADLVSSYRQDVDPQHQQQDKQWIVERTRQTSRKAQIDH